MDIFTLMYIWNREQCSWFTLFSFHNIFQPDYEQQLMDESRFRQQLEARNKNSKKNERKHGKIAHFISLIILRVCLSGMFCCRWSILLRTEGQNTKFRQVQSSKGEGEREKRREQICWYRSYERHWWCWWSPPGLGWSTAGISRQWWVWHYITHAQLFHYNIFFLALHTKQDNNHSTKHSLSLNYHL